MGSELTLNAPSAALRADRPERHRGSRPLFRWRSTFGLLLGPHALGLLDQAIVSATSFLVTVIVGRWTDPDQLGLYALALSVVALALATQESLVTRPYSIQLHRPIGSPAAHALGALALSALLGIAAGFCAAALMLTIGLLGQNHAMQGFAWFLAAALPFIMNREFGRRFAFARLDFRLALLIDTIAAAVTAMALGMLAWADALSATTALAAIGLGCGMGALVWLPRARRSLAFRPAPLSALWQQSWAIGKWFLSGQIAMQVQSYASSWLAFLLVGAGSAGIYLACGSVVALMNPFLYGFFNVLTPKFVHVLRFEGVAALRRRVFRETLVVAGVTAVFSIVLVVFGSDILRLLYVAPDYVAHAPVVSVLACASFVASIGVPASLALAASERARVVAFVMIATASLNIILVAAALPLWGIIGAAWGVLIAEALGSIGRWSAFLAFLPASAAGMPGATEMSPDSGSRRE